MICKTRQGELNAEDGTYVPMFISPHLPNENLKQYNLPHIFILRLFLITNIKYYESEAR